MSFLINPITGKPQFLKENKMISAKSEVLSVKPAAKPVLFLDNRSFFCQTRPEVANYHGFAAERIKHSASWESTYYYSDGLWDIFSDNFDTIVFFRDSSKSGVDDQLRSLVPTEMRDISVLEKVSYRPEDATHIFEETLRSRSADRFALVVASPSEHYETFIRSYRGSDPTRSMGIVTGYEVGLLEEDIKRLIAFSVGLDLNKEQPKTQQVVETEDFFPELGFDHGIYGHY